MLSTKYRQRMEFIWSNIEGESKDGGYDLTQKLAKHHHSAESMLRILNPMNLSQEPDMIEGGLSDFMNQLDLGDPDPTRHKSRFESADEIMEWFKRDKTDDWRQRD